jgi:hypothetical protein
MRWFRFAAGKFRSFRFRSLEDMGCRLSFRRITPRKTSASQPFGAIPRRSVLTPSRGLSNQLGTAEFVGTFTLIFVGAGSIFATAGGNLTAIGLAAPLRVPLPAPARA